MHPIDLPKLPDQPLVSILLTSYNYGRFIGEAIESALRQTYKNLEIIICDDESTDDSVQIIEKYARQDSRIKFVPQAHAGFGSAYNTAFQHSKGAILVLLDSDDYCAPGRVEAVVRMYCEREGVGFVSHPLIMVDRDSRYLQPLTLLDNFDEGWIADKIIRRGGLWRAMLSSGVSFRRELAPYVYPVPDKWIGADLLANTLLPLVTRVGVVREYLGYYRRHENQASGELRNFGTCDEAIESFKRFNYQMEVAIDLINARILKLKIDSPLIDVNKNFDYRLRAHAIELFAGAPIWRRIRSYATVFSLVRAHDMYKFKTKVIMVTAYGVAMLLPRRMRPRLIAALHTPNKLKTLLLGRRKNKEAVALNTGADLAAR